MQNCKLATNLAQQIYLAYNAWQPVNMSPITTQISLDSTSACSTTTIFFLGNTPMRGGCVATWELHTKQHSTFAKAAFAGTLLMHAYNFQELCKASHTAGHMDG